MLSRLVLAVLLLASVAGCVDSQRLREDLGGPKPAPEQSK